MRSEHLFIIDSLENLNLKLDTSFKLAFQLQKLGDSLQVCYLPGMEWDSKRGVLAEIQELSFSLSGDSYQLGGPQTRALNEYQFIHVRKEPPVDFNFIAMTYLLDRVDSRVKILNHPKALRSLNEKLIPLQFTEHHMPTLIVSKFHRAEEFVRALPSQKAIVKPLNLFGGRGIFSWNLSEDDPKQIRESFLELTDNQSQMVLVQEFHEGIYDGEVRVFTAAGKAIAWCLKRPKPGEYLANTRSGAVLESYSPTEVVANRVEEVAQRLLQEGVLLTGMDVIGDKITEVNITSPRLLSSDLLSGSQGESDHEFELLARACLS